MRLPSLHLRKLFCGASLVVGSTMGGRAARQKCSSSSGTRRCAVRREKAAFFYDPYLNSPGFRQPLLLPFDIQNIQGIYMSGDAQNSVTREASLSPLDVVSHRWSGSLVTAAVGMLIFRAMRFRPMLLGRIAPSRGQEDSKGMRTPISQMLRWNTDIIAPWAHSLFFSSSSSSSPPFFFFSSKVFAEAGHTGAVKLA